MTATTINPHLHYTRVNELEPGAWAYMPQRTPQRTEGLALGLCLNQSEDAQCATILLLDGVRPGIHRIDHREGPFLMVTGEIEIAFAPDTLTQHEEPSDWEGVRFAVFPNAHGFLVIQHGEYDGVGVAVRLDSLGPMEPPSVYFWTQTFTLNCRGASGQPWRELRKFPPKTSVE